MMSKAMTCDCFVANNEATKMSNMWNREFVEQVSIRETLLNANSRHNLILVVQRLYSFRINKIRRNAKMSHSHTFQYATSNLRAASTLMRGLIDKSSDFRPPLNIEYFFRRPDWITMGGSFTVRLLGKKAMILDHLAESRVGMPDMKEETEKK
jgi:hypothetical protein